MSRKPQPVSVEQSFAGSQEMFEALKNRLRSQEALRWSHSELERTLHRDGMEVLRQLMQEHLSLRARQEQEQGLDRPVLGADEVERKQQRSGSIRMMSLFGPVRVERVSYQHEGVKSLKPLEAHLNVPPDSYSHEVRRRVALEAVRGSFDAAVEAIDNHTGAHVPKRQAQELICRAAHDYIAFYERRSTLAAGRGELVVLSADGKGVVMRLEGLLEATRQQAQHQKHKMHKRLSRGEKKDRKRMATVAAVYTVQPYYRTPEDIVAELSPVHWVNEEQERPRPQDKRVWASLVKTPELVLRECFEEGLRRDPNRQRTWVALTDGNKKQLRLFKKLAKDYDIKLIRILDIIHVLEYLWAATTVFNQESTPEAEQWVDQRFLEVLRGRAHHVAAGIRRSATKRGLSAERRNAADKCASYLLKHAAYMDYAQYLSRGFPIATGVIEGACRYLIKDRMDITGARWGLAGAEAVLCLRALWRSGDFDDYWAFHEACEYERNHLASYADQSIPQLRTSSKRPRSNRGHLRLVD